MWNLWKRKISLEEQVEISLEEQMIRKIVECTHDGTLRWERQGTEYPHVYQADDGNIQFLWCFLAMRQQLIMNNVTVCTSWNLLFDVYWAIKESNPLKAETIQCFLDRFTDKTKSITT